MDAIQRELLMQVTGLHEVPEGAYNIRADGESVERNSTSNIEIITKEDKTGIEIHIKPGTKHESVHIPVVLSKSGLTEVVYNDFYIGDDADVTIIAGCGIHNGGDAASRHDGIHRFYIGKNAHIKYVEKHYGSGDGKGERIMNPVTEIHLDEDSFMEMDTAQIKGVDSTKRENRAYLKDGAKLIVMETSGRKAILTCRWMEKTAPPTLFPVLWQGTIPISCLIPISTETTAAAGTPNVMRSLWIMPGSALRRSSLQIM